MQAFSVEQDRLLLAHNWLAGLRNLLGVSMEASVNPPGCQGAAARPARPARAPGTPPRPPAAPRRSSTAAAAVTPSAHMLSTLMTYGCGIVLVDVDHNGNWIIVNVNATLFHVIQQQHPCHNAAEQHCMALLHRH
jgi:hypothetical protein